MAEKFEDLRKPELLAVAEQFAVDVKPAWKVEEIIKAIQDDGVDWAQYQRALRATEAHEAEAEALVEDFIEPEPLVIQPVVVVEKEQPTEIVLKMTRANWIYETHGYRFSQEHPFVLVDPDKADSILRREEGFRTATPQELREYYGQE